MGLFKSTSETDSKDRNKAAREDPGGFRLPRSPPSLLKASVTARGGGDCAQSIM